MVLVGNTQAERLHLSKPLAPVHPRKTSNLYTTIMQPASSTSLASSNWNDDDSSESEGQDVGKGEHFSNMQITYRLRVYASQLPRRGAFSRLPDSFALVTAAPDFSHTLAKGGVRLGATEVILNSRNPEWTATFLLNYTHGTQLFFNILVLEPSQANSYSTNDGFGSAVFEVADILGTKHRTRARRLRKGGVVFCRLDPVEQSNTRRFAVMRLCARDLVVPRKFKRFASAPDTIIKIERQDRSTRNWTTIYRSQPVEESYNPSWDRIEIDLSNLSHGDTNPSLRFLVAEVRDRKRASTIGMIETTLSHLMEGVSYRTGSTLPEPEDPNLPTFTLQQAPGSSKLTGLLVVRGAYLYEILPDGTRKAVDGYVADNKGNEQSNRNSYGHHRMPSSVRGSFVDANSSSLDGGLLNDLKSIVQSGCDLQVSVAIDFTSSNGDPRLETSLHYQSPSLNVYEETISTIIEALDEQAPTSTGYTVWGFGAKFSDGIVRHIFQCGQESCHSVTDILDAYKSVFSLGFSLSGPTCFDKVMQAAAVRAKRSKDEGLGQYHILLIITDGSISNMGETRRKLSVYQSLPFSIIFVGVGRADMRDLGALCKEFPDESVFVDFREMQSNPVDLANAALGSLGRQISEYSSKHPTWR